MSQLIVVGYPDLTRAQQVLATVWRMEKEHLVDLEDAAIVTRTEKGRVRLIQTQDVAASGIVGGSFLGLMIGLLFLNPILGLVVGSASGALAGWMSDVGVSDDFMRELGKQLAPGSAALFILVRRGAPDRIVEELAPHGGTLLRTNLSRHDENELRALIERIQAEARGDGPPPR
ncbi:MAG TPA: DUF1269 domain-containing protein [Nannocystis sp.]